MPEKFLKLLQFIKDQLFYNSADYIVILDQREWEKLGLSKIDVMQGIQHLQENGIAIKAKVYNELHMSAGIPSTSKGRIAMLNGHLSELAWQFIARIGAKKFKAQIALQLDKKFDEFYKAHTSGDKKAVEKLSSKPELKFNIADSILTLNGEEIHIRQKSDQTYGHFVLEYIFYKNVDGLGAKISYSDILDEMLILEDATVRSCYRACHDIQDKVREQTKAKIDDFFLHIKTGDKGWAQINPKYIPTKQVYP